jgi:ubiquilin
MNPMFNMFGQGAAPNMGMPGMGMGMGGDPTQMMNNPMFAQAMSQMLSNPQMMDMIINSNPQLAGMVTPEMRQQMQTPQFRAMMSNPQVIQQMMQMQQMFGGMGGMGGMGAGMNPLNNMYGQTPTSTVNNPYADTPNAATTGNPTPPVNPFFNPAVMQSMMAGMNPPATQPTRPPEELYQTQLAQLQEMGFFHPQENIRALQMTGGNVEAAVEWLFSRPPGQ